jgi:hypothetical protein
MQCIEEAAVPKPFPFEQLLPHNCTVEVRIRSHELAKQLAAMRLWLDRNGCRNQVFHCRPSGAEAVIRVEFNSDSGRFSEAFRRNFG